jgi:hypothetical protein
MLKIQEYLRSGKSPENLENDFAIHFRQHGRYPHLFGFKYDQLDSPMGERIVQECRGLILDSKNDWDVVAYSFDKFYNYGEGHAAEIDWDSAVVQEKYDGSLIIMYCYDALWQVATSGSPDASGMTHGSDIPFSDYFWNTFKKGPGLKTFPFMPKGCPFSSISNDYTFMFELMGPLNRVVIPHSESRLVILGGRNKKTLQEITAEEAAEMFGGLFPSVKEFPLQNIEDIINTFETFSGVEQEGYVIVDKFFNRMKVKHPGYVALHHAKSDFTPRACVKIAISGEISEVETHFPELADDLLDARTRFESLCVEVESDYERLKDIENQKSFAIEAVKTKASGALFNVRNGKAKSIRRFLTDMHVDKLMRLMGY